jgi:hypothetical protein
MLTVTKEAESLWQQRRCFVCLAEIPPTRAVHCYWLRILYCADGNCGNVVNELEKDRSRTWKGRRRPRGEVLALIRQHRGKELPAAPAKSDKPLHELLSEYIRPQVKMTVLPDGTGVVAIQGVDRPASRTQFVRHFVNDETRRLGMIAAGASHGVSRSWLEAELRFLWGDLLQEALSKAGK